MPKSSAHARHRAKSAAEPEATFSTRPFWSGTLTFGLVSIPVEFYPAERAGGVRSHWIAPDGTPLKRRYFCPKHDEEVSADHLIRGYERDDGSYVPISDEELEGLDPEKSSDIALQQFVAVSEIDPLYFDRAYFLGIAGGAGKAYGLLAQVMEKSHLAGVATLVMRESEHVVAIFSERGLLVAQTLRFQDELRAPLELSKSKPSAALVGKMTKAIERLGAKSVALSELADDDGERLQKLVKQKAKTGKDVVVIEDAVEDTTEQVVDLMKLLKQSLREAGVVKPEKAARTPKASRAKTRSGKRG